MTPELPLLLYIDDDAALARLVDRGLKRQGFRVEHAADGESGVARILQGGVDVVALDQYMPGLDGLETLLRVRALEGAPPVVFVTASLDSRIAVTALKAGATDYLVKDTHGDFIALLGVAAAGALKGERLRKAKEAAEAEVRAARDRFEALAAEREMLLREVNHRVGNSLQIIASLLHLQAASTEDDGVKAALTNAMGRVAAVAQVHRRLYTSHNLKTVMLNQYLQALLEDLRRSAESDKLTQLSLDSEAIEIDPDRAVAIGIVANELIMNAVKYAYPDGAGAIHVALHRRDDEIELSIADNGVGILTLPQPGSTGLGQRIVSAMASKLDATIARDDAHEGTRIVMRFRAEKPALQPINAA